MHSRAIHLIRLLTTVAIVAAAPIAQAGNPKQLVSSQKPDTVRAAYTAAWQAYRGLPGGPPARTVSDPVRAAYTAAWQAYRGLPGGPPARKLSDPVRAAYTAAWQAYRGLPGGPPLKTQSTKTQSTSATPLSASSSAGFDWGDAGIGAGILLGLVLVGGAAFYATREVGKPQTA
jgi:hypothetical protein